MDQQHNLTREEFEAAQEAFEFQSTFYFCGESPSERIVYWKVWLQSWEMSKKHFKKLETTENSSTIKKQ